MKNKKSTKVGLTKQVTGKAVRPPHPHSSQAASDNIGSSFPWLGPLGVKNKRPHVKTQFLPHPCGLQIYGPQVETPPPYLGDYTGAHHDFYFM